MRFCSVAALGALAVSAILVQPAAAASAPDGTAYHLYRPGVPAQPAASPPGAKTMLYYGGPVISTVKVAVVLWGPTVPKSITSRLTPYFKAMVNSTYIDQLAQYATNITGVNGHMGTNQTIGRGSFRGKFKITPANMSTNLTDGDVQTELKAQIAAGKLPPADLNTLYMIYFPANITISLGSLKSCQAFGAYHEAVSSTVTPANIFYGIMPDCGGGFTTATVVSSHEFAEAITDAIPTPGSHPAYPQAWNSSNGSEIGDLCEGRDTTLSAAGQVYQVQEIFTNSTNACATGKFTSP
ncbi:MAG: hypothetical protein ABI306_08650 [Caulobacteraceae bacterium]